MRNDNKNVLFDGVKKVTPISSVPFTPVPETRNDCSRKTAYKLLIITV